jgi:hypothetical protein
MSEPMKRFGKNSEHANSSFGFFLLCVYAALVLIRPHEWPAVNIEFSILRTILIATFIAYLIGVRPKTWNAQCTIMVLMFFSMLLSEVRAFRYFSDLSIVLDWIYSNIIPFLLFLGFLISIRRQRVILFISIAACLVMVQHAYVQINSPTGEGWAETVIYRYDTGKEMIQVRYIGIFNDPNDMGMFLVMNVPIAAYFMVTAKGMLMRLASFGTLCLMLVGVYWTGSRGSLVGLMAVFFSFFYIRYGKIKSIILAGITLPAVLVLMGTSRAISKDDDSALQRLTAWYEGIQMLKHRPLFGFGKGRFLEYHPKVAHNSYVTMMAELGTVGYVLWMMFVILIFFMLIRIIKMPQEKESGDDRLKQERTLSIYLMVSIIGYCTTAFFISRSFIMFFYIFAAMVAAAFFRVNSTYPQFDLSFKGKDLFKVFLLSVMSLIALYFLITVLLSI